MRSPARRFILLLCAFQLSIAAQSPAAHIGNFGKVNDHIYRGAEPSLVGLQELGAMGVKLVIDLRESSQSTEFERQQVEKLHMKYVNVPFAPFSAPTQEQVKQVLSLLLKNNSDPVFVHCRRGRDRTGTVVACYRIQHDGWDNQHAFTEAKEFGISFAERGMRSYILHFSRMAMPDSGKVGDQPTFAGLPGVPARP
ncbi:MAG: tyrosine-protein phosphatase [Bryobacteraceae bacterium]